MDSGDTEYQKTPAVRASLEHLMQPIRAAFLKCSDANIETEGFTYLGWASLSHVLLIKAELTQMSLAIFKNPTNIDSRTVEGWQKNMVEEVTRLEILIHKFMGELANISEFKPEGGLSGSTSRNESVAVRNPSNDQSK